jgi:hypothetical protein
VRERALFVSWLRSSYVSPRPAVNGRVGRYVTDAEFIGQLTVSQPVRPSRPQLPHFSGGQLSPGVPLPNGAIIATMTFPAPWLESDPDVIAGGIGRRPVLSVPAAINARVIAGRSPGLRDPVVQYVIRGVSRLPGGAHEPVTARARAGPAAAPDHGRIPADRAALPLVSGLPARAAARPGIARDQRTDGGRGLVPAVTAADSGTRCLAVWCGCTHFPDDSQPPEPIPWPDDVPYPGPAAFC